jgi:SAM-dependent methyltransferase
LHKFLQLTHNLNTMNKLMLTTTKSHKLVEQSQWFQHWFDTSFYHQLYGNRNETEAADFVNELLMELNPVPGSAMLDLGCGAGRHSKFLAAKGFDVTGIDLSGASIRMARRSEADNLRFFLRDMREPFGTNLFDYVFNFFTSFGYFEDDSDNCKVISNMSAALKPGGIVLIDYINAPVAVGKIIPLEIKEIDGAVYSITKWTDDRNIYKRISIDAAFSDDPVEYIEQVAKLSVNEFEKMFSVNGLVLEELFGDYHLHPYRPETSPRLILKARKIKS